MFSRIVSPSHIHPPDLRETFRHVAFRKQRFLLCSPGSMHRTSLQVFTFLTATASMVSALCIQA
ncbi:hypothetical protein, partial [Verrucomicrobium spinosum]|uniref:hypothetical protein n=1 Tax=Verrucomicrobium spinosum TaxID=2736 RepID=UPI001C47ECF4